MDISKHTGPESGRRSRRRGFTRAGFSLVEVTMAIGIVAFAFIALFGMLPTGLTTFRQAIDTSVGSQIAQRVINEAQQTDFTTLTASGTNTGSSFDQSTRYFDDQGNEVTATNAATQAIYQVNTRITPATVVPAGASFSSMATVTVQIAHSPGNQTITSGTANLWTDPRFSISTYFGFVSRNQ